MPGHQAGSCATNFEEVEGCKGTEETESDKTLSQRHAQTGERHASSRVLEVAKTGEKCPQWVSSCCRHMRLHAKRQLELN